MDHSQEDFYYWCRLSGLHPDKTDEAKMREDLDRIFRLTSEMDYPPQEDLQPMIYPGDSEGRLRKDSPAEAENLANEIKLQPVTDKKYFIIRKNKSGE